MNELSRLRGSERYGVRDDDAAPGGKGKTLLTGSWRAFPGFNSLLVWNWLSPHPRLAAYRVLLSFSSRDPRGAF